MKYTVQFFIAGYAAPEGHETSHFNTLEGIKYALLNEHEEAEKYGAGYEPSEALIWKGHLKDTTDVYPDRQAIIGPRGGVQFHIV